MIGKSQVRGDHDDSFTLISRFMRENKIRLTGTVTVHNCQGGIRVREPYFGYKD